MKYVDEFRDPEQAKVLLREIEELEPPALHYGGLRRPHPFDL